MTDTQALDQIVMLARRAVMSTSYKPALLKALVRIVRRTPANTISLATIGAEFVRMYWTQTVVFHLRQAATVTKEPAALAAIRMTSATYMTRKLEAVPAVARDRLEHRMARILTVDVLRRFHASAPATMAPLFSWTEGDSHLSLTQTAVTFLSSNDLTLESLANLWWARYLERVNVLTPYIIDKVERDGAKRASLMKYLRILQQTDSGGCFYCERPFDSGLPVTVDHVIPWSFLLADPPWDLVLACAQCNGAKSDVLPQRPFLDKLLMVNEARSKLMLPKHFASPLIAGHQIEQYYDAALAVEWPAGWQP